jgi:DNA-3-methyladenine glycosylase I
MTQERTRCSWPGTSPLYVAYHDDEWGVPERDDRALYEKLVLDGFQAGLAWITVLRKRDAFREAFDGFDPALVARYDEAKVAQLLQNAGIIRHRGKIEGAIASARAWEEVRDAQGSFADFVWGFVDGRMKVNTWRSVSEIPAQSAESEALSKALKKRGFRFCGPTIVYAFMQAVGMVNDHVVSCYRHAECAALAEKLV